MLNAVLNFTKGNRKPLNRRWTRTMSTLGGAGGVGDLVHSFVSFFLSRRRTFPSCINIIITY